MKPGYLTGNTRFFSCYGSLSVLLFPAIYRCQVVVVSVPHNDVK
jgi:hypothetical protein